MDDERDSSSVDDQAPGSQGEIESGSEGEFGGSDALPLDAELGAGGGGTEGSLGTGDDPDTGVDEEYERRRRRAGLTSRVRGRSVRFAGPRGSARIGGGSLARFQSPSP